MIQAKFFRKIGAFAAAAALSAALAPGMAFAADYSDTTVSNSTTGPDNVVAVSWSEGSDNFTCNVDLTDVTQHTNKMGALFAKANSNNVTVHNVIGTSQWVSLSDVISAAVVPVDTEELDNEGQPIYEYHYATSAWNTAQDSIDFKVWNYNNTTEEYELADYTKYTLGFTKTKLDGCNNFYGGSLAESLVSDSTTEYTSGAILALNGASQAMIAGDTVTTAQDVLDAMSISATTTAPRLMWGYESASIAGNRFPSNIDAITIEDADAS